MNGIRWITTLCAALLAIITSSAIAQPNKKDGEAGASRASTRGAIVGRLTDDAGAPIVGAAIQLPQFDRTTTTDKEGKFALRDIGLSSTVVHVRALGFQQVTRQLVVRPGEESRLDLSLEPASVQLASMVISAAARAVDPTTPLDVAALEPEKLKAFATASLGRTLERLPGVSSISTGPMSGNPVLRGMSQGQIRLTRDGVALESFQGTSRWTPPISFGSVDRVEVIRGPASVLYGSSALGGAVNFLPKALPRAESGQPAVHGLVESQYFSNNNEKYFNGELSAAIAAGVGLRAGLNTRHAGNFTTGDALSYTVTKVKHDPLYVGKLNYSNYEQRGSYAQLGAAGQWGQLQALYDGFDGYNNFLNANGKPTGVRNQNYEFRLRGSLMARSWVIKPALVFQNVRIQRSATAAKTFEDARANALWDQDLGKQVYTARVEAEHAPIKALAGKIGAEYQYQDGVVRLSAIEPSSDVYDAAVFALEEYRRNRLTLSAGARFDYRDQRAAKGSLVAALPVDQQEDALHRTFSVANGSFGVGLRLTDAVTWTSSVSTGFHAPAIQDLYTNENRPAFGWLEGNPRLEPERSLSVESSLRLQTRRVAGQVTGYRNRVTDYIYMLNTGRTRQVGAATRTVFALSQTDAVLRGIEIGAEAEALSSVFIEGSYAAMKTENIATGEALPLMPANNLRGSVRYAPVRFAFIRAPFVRAGGRHVWAKQIAGLTEPFADADVNPAGFGIGSTPAYTLYEAGVGGRIVVGVSPVDVSVDAQNLFNTAYRDFLDTQKGFAMSMGRNVSVRVSVPFALSR